MLKFYLNNQIKKKIFLLKDCVVCLLLIASYTTHTKDIYSHMEKQFTHTHTHIPYSHKYCRQGYSDVKSNRNK